LNGWIDLTLLVTACALLVPVVVFCLECTLAMPRRRLRTLSSTSTRPRVAVLVPAHDEESGIGHTLRTILPQLRDGDRVVVVADNCTDATADIAADAGCEVVHRVNRARRGKGYALDAGVRHIVAKGDAPDVLIVFDADCLAQPNCVTALACRAAETGRPVQGTYVMALPPQPHAGAAVSALAVLVKNFVRPRGLSRLGLPCLLTGTGMAFPWPVIRGADLASGNIVEDMQLGLDLAVAGHAPVFCEEARVIGLLPSAIAAAQTQRRRWEHGHLRTLIRETPRLLVHGRLALLLELCVPPLSLLAILTTLATALAALSIPLFHASPVPALLLAGGLAWVALCVVGAWLRFGRRAMPVASVLGAPAYALSKVPLYANFVRRCEKEWVRTARTTPAAPSPRVITSGKV
jgi:cellulose synthase/poly-beta-1,6-N-acetylglucosamine synthase-like glycosyltransferase